MLDAFRYGNINQLSSVSIEEKITAFKRSRLFFPQSIEPSRLLPLYALGSTLYALRPTLYALRSTLYALRPTLYALSSTLTARGVNSYLFFTAVLGRA